MRILTFGLVFILAQALRSQYTVDRVEGYILKPVFDFGIKNNFNIIIEKDKDSKVTRKWIFDKNRRLIKELDFRESGFSSSMGGQTISSSITFQEFKYRYGGDGKVIEVVELMVQDADTLKKIRRFDHTTDNLIKENYILGRNNLLSKEVSELTYSHRTLKDSVIFTSVGRGNGFYSEWISKTIFNYGEDDKVIRELSYFKSNFFPLPEGQKPMKNQLSFVREYDYDELARIRTITDYHYDESGNSKVDQISRFKYQGSTSKIIGLNFPKFNGSDDENFVLELEYKNDGCLKQISTDYGKKYYEYTKGE